jgi:Mrp family chromosome partitioning ATPase/capsular polysaccharide biosynthesis protein
MLLVAGVAAGLAGYVSASSSQPTYDAKAVLLVGPLSTEIDTLRAAGNLAQTYAQLAMSRPLLTATEQKLKLPGIGSDIKATASQVTRLLTIDARDANPVLAAKIANTHAALLMERAAARKPRPGGPGQLQMVDPAAPEKVAVGPGAALIALMAALAGIGGALGLALLLDRPGEAINSSDDLKGLGVSFLGMLEKGAGKRDRTGRSILDIAPRSRAAEQYRLLAAKLVALGSRSLLVLSTEDDGGAVAANIAAALGASGARVALLDADEGSEQEPASRGWRSRLRKAELEAGGDEEAQEGGGVQVLTRPAALPSSTGALDQARQMLADLGAEHDMVVVHARPLGRSVSALAWGRITDGTLLVAVRDRTPTEDLRTALESLELVRAPILGTVLATTTNTPWQ